ncbi:MAG: protease modulator HflC [Candidatus Cloacimonadales bacterium]
MKTKRTILIVVLVALIAIFNSFYIQDETEQSIITQFGEPMGEANKDAGLHLKIPFIQKVHFFEKRILQWDGDTKQIPTSDKRYIWIDTFSRWRISDPLKFYETTRFESSAHSRLDDIISGTTRDIISSNKLLEIVRSTNRKMEFTAEYQTSTFEEEVILKDIGRGRKQIAVDIFEASKEKITEYGIELIDVEIKRLNYNDEVQSKVFERMVSERNKIAAQYRSEGEGKAAEILGRMQKELDQIESEAYKTAQEVKGRADATAINIYANAYNRDPDFYQFLKTLETYEETIGENNTLILSTDSDYFKYLKSVK